MSRIITERHVRNPRKYRNHRDGRNGQCPVPDIPCAGSGQFRRFNQSHLSGLYSNAKIFAGNPYNITKSYVGGISGYGGIIENCYNSAAFVVGSAKYDIKSKNEAFLREDIELQNMQIALILVNPQTNETITLASDGQEKMIQFAPYTPKENGDENGYMNVPEWDFNFDTYLFEE